MYCESDVLRVADTHLVTAVRKYRFVLSIDLLYPGFRRFDEIAPDKIACGPYLAAFLRTHDPNHGCISIPSVSLPVRDRIPDFEHASIDIQTKKRALPFGRRTERDARSGIVHSIRQFDGAEIIQLHVLEPQTFRLVIRHIRIEDRICRNLEHRQGGSHCGTCYLVCKLHVRTCRTDDFAVVRHAERRRNQRRAFRAALKDKSGTLRHHYFRERGRTG